MILQEEEINYGLRTVEILTKTAKGGQCDFQPLAIPTY
jgi:hypothetical protein